MVDFHASFSLSSGEEKFLNMGVFRIKDREQQDFRLGGGDAPG